MGMGSHAAKAVKKYQKAQYRLELSEIKSGLRKGPLTLLHESGRPHPWRKCPVCCTKYIHDTNS